MKMINELLKCNLDLKLLVLYSKFSSSMFALSFILFWNEIDWYVKEKIAVLNNLWA